MAHLSDYTVLVCNSVTDTIIGEVDPVTIQYSEELNRAGAATITIPLDTAATKLPTLAPLAQSVYLLRDDVPVWAGIVWRSTVQGSSVCWTGGASGIPRSLLQKTRR